MTSASCEQPWPRSSPIRLQTNTTIGGIARQVLDYRQLCCNKALHFATPRRILGVPASKCWKRGGPHCIIQRIQKQPHRRSEVTTPTLHSASSGRAIRRSHEPKAHLQLSGAKRATSSMLSAISFVETLPKETRAASCMPSNVIRGVVVELVPRVNVECGKRI